MTLTLTCKFQKGKHLIFDLNCLESFCTKRLCFYALNYVFWPLGLFLKIKGPLKGHFFKSLKVPHYGVIKTLCAKNEVCKSISMTCSTYRRITKDLKRKILQNDRKRALKGPKIIISKNKTNVFFTHVPMSIMPKKRFLGLKLWPLACGQTDRHTHRMDTEYPIRALAFQSFCLWYERSNILITYFYQ